MDFQLNPENQKHYELIQRNNTIKRLRKHYSETVVDHCLYPRNFRRMEIPDGYALSRGDDGDMIEIFVRLENNRVTECTFQTNGCASTLACGSIASELARNKTYQEALTSVRAEHIIEALGGLPEGNFHCAVLVSAAIRLALADSFTQKKSPLKKLYRRYGS